MNALQPDTRRAAYISNMLSLNCPEAAHIIACAISDKYPGAGIMLYGSGISVMEKEDAANVLYDFYVIVPSYRAAYGARWLAAANVLVPPNVFYIETPSQQGMLRAKYAVLSLEHFQKLVSEKTFHSYFWARFAQPSRIVSCPPEMRVALEQCVAAAIDRFVMASSALIKEEKSVANIWKAGLSASYKAELRAEAPDRVDKLLAAYGNWPEKVTGDLNNASSVYGALAWRLRKVQGAFLSVIRLLKGVFTFEGGVDYILWKIKRHAGFEVPVRDWERRWPLIASPFLAYRYFRLKRQHR